MLQVISIVNVILKKCFDGWNKSPTPRPPSRAGASRPLAAGAMAYCTGLAYGSGPWLAAIALLRRGFVKGSSIRGISYGSLNLSLDLILDKALTLRVIKGVAGGHELITHPNPPSREGKDNKFDRR